MNKPVAYSSLISELEVRLSWLNFGQVYYELCGGKLKWNQVSIGQAFREVALKLEKMFTIYDYVMFGTADEIEGGEWLLDEGVPNLEGMVMFHGLSLERDWTDWDIISQLIMAIFFHQPSGYEEIPGWWTGMKKKYRLPPLESVDSDQVLSRLEELPSPWDGLEATFHWFSGIGNCFVDIPPEYVMDFF